MNAGKFIGFLKALLDSVPGKVFLIVDGHPVHRAKKVSEFVKEKADGRLSIFFLPPYSPDLNPDEWVWNNVKNDRIGRSVIMSADDLKQKAIGALRRLQKLPGVVRGFLRDPKLDERGRGRYVPHRGAELPDAGASGWPPGPCPAHSYGWRTHLPDRDQIKGPVPVRDHPRRNLSHHAP